MHVLLHHKETQTCKLCSETFGTESCLDKHMLMNINLIENRICELCDETFGTQSYLDEPILMKHQSHENPDL